MHSKMLFPCCLTRKGAFEYFRIYYWILTVASPDQANSHSSFQDQTFLPTVLKGGSCASSHAVSHLCYLTGMSPGPVPVALKLSFGCLALSACQLLILSQVQIQEWDQVPHLLLTSLFLLNSSLHSHYKVIHSQQSFLNSGLTLPVYSFFGIVELIQLLLIFDRVFQDFANLSTFNTVSW